MRNHRKDAILDQTCTVRSGVSQEPGTLSSGTRLSRSPPGPGAAAAMISGDGGEARTTAGT
jgi:hypothetical protein